ncbi:hypothetical protein [Spirillospora sp. CA-128828]|uniref:hypothetical protein n=1 Tax=Spirillospora sp. CA-128828 TaxID=3240033 RepID=UPI003D94F713
MPVGAGTQAAHLRDLLGGTDVRYLLEPDGLRGEAVSLADGDQVAAQADHRDARAGQARFRTVDCAKYH